MLAGYTIKEQDGGFNFGNVLVHKYTKKAFFNNEWNEGALNSRGHVYSLDGEVIAMPFKKTFNYLAEDMADKFSPNELVWSFKKINGFMVAVSYHKGEVVVSTTGTVNSKFVEMAKEYISLSKFKKVFEEEYLEDYTLLFECVHPDDPHIVKHEVGVYYLGARYKYSNPEGVNLVIPVFEFIHKEGLFKLFLEEDISWDSGKLTTVEKAYEESEYVAHEGFMIYSTDFQRCVKMKSPYYLCKKLLMRCKEVNDKVLTKYKKLAGGNVELLNIPYVLGIETYSGEIQLLKQKEFNSFSETERGDHFEKSLYYMRM